MKFPHPPLACVILGAIRCHLVSDMINSMYLDCLWCGRFDIIKLKYVWVYLQDTSFLIVLKLQVFSILDIHLNLQVCIYYAFSGKHWARLAFLVDFVSNLKVVLSVAAIWTRFSGCRMMWTRSRGLASYILCNIYSEHCNYHNLV